MQENGQTLCMSDVSYLPVLEMSAENSRKYCCPKPGKSRLSGQLKSVDLAALARYYDGRSYCDSDTACGSRVLSSKERSSWGLVNWVDKLGARRIALSYSSGFDCIMVCDEPWNTTCAYSQLIVLLFHCLPAQINIGLIFLYADFIWRTGGSSNQVNLTLGSYLHMLV